MHFSYGPRGVWGRSYPCFSFLFLLFVITRNFSFRLEKKWFLKRTKQNRKKGPRASFVILSSSVAIWVFFKTCNFFFLPIDSCYSLSSVDITPSIQCQQIHTHTPKKKTDNNFFSFFLMDDLFLPPVQHKTAFIHCLLLMTVEWKKFFFRQEDLCGRKKKTNILQIRENFLARTLPFKNLFLFLIDLYWRKLRIFFNLTNTDWS